MADVHLFGRDTDETPELTEKLAYGTDSTPAKNMTFTGLINYLFDRLGFFKTSNNLSEGNETLIRNNINVYSVTEINDFLTYKADKENVIEKDSTETFNPTLSTHPTNKGYVDNKILLAGEFFHLDSGFTYNKYQGSLTMTATVEANGHYRITHNLNSLNYYVICQSLQGYNGAVDIQVGGVIPSANYFDVYTSKDGASFSGSLCFEMRPKTT